MRDCHDPRLLITAWENNSRLVKISVSDNGVGISDELSEKIFLPFYSTKSGKSGIGLSLSQHIMMLHHGRLEVSSESGKGVTFIMIF